MRYLSLFSGIGGLESPATNPVLCCESDPECSVVLQRRFPGVTIRSDVRELHPPEVDVVTGGWPCQDLSVAGLRRGLAGERSGLFFEMVRVAVEARAHTIVAENVPHLLTLEGGRNFDLVMATLERAGYPFVAWRLLNARSFGLPHDRKRIFIVATKHREFAVNLHRPLGGLSLPSGGKPSSSVSAFYWTAGLQSLCYSRGFVPTLKVGSALSIPSPPALHFDHSVRLVRPEECLRLQGFEASPFVGLRPSTVYRMAGNAVASPVGRFVVQSLDVADAPEPTVVGFGFTSPAGIYEKGTKHAVGERAPFLCDDLDRFVDLADRVSLSTRAASGLLRRLARSHKDCPRNLREDLERIASGPAGPLDAAESEFGHLDSDEEELLDDVSFPRGDQLSFFERG